MKNIDLKGGNPLNVLIDDWQIIDRDHRRTKEQLTVKSFSPRPYNGSLYSFAVRIEGCLGAWILRKEICFSLNFPYSIH